MSKISKIADVVSSQFPNFVQDDYPTFVAFLEAYYQFLDEQKLTRNLEYVKDIDKTLDEFISYIRNEIAPETPQNNKFFLNYSKKAQLARGSESSYKSVFRFLLQKEIEIEYPSEKMLKVSGGEWQQDISFFLNVTSGDPFALIDDYLYVNCTKVVRHKHRVYVKNIKKVESSTDIYEIFIAKNFYGDLDIGDTINYKGVVGTIIPTSSKVKILNPGSGFKAGQIFTISTPIANGMHVKVLKTNPDGGLKHVQVVSFGIGFKKNFYFNINRYQVPKASQSILAPNIFVDEVLNQDDFGVINDITYHSDYTYGNYVGEVMTDFYGVSAPAEVEQTVATLSIELGAIARYPGYYKSSSSLIDEDSYIQDGNYYQDFSYVIRLDEKLDRYRDAILSIVHPVGRKLFGEYKIETDFALNLEISNPVIRILIPQLTETIESASIVDKTIYRVDNFKFIGAIDPETGVLQNSWTLYSDVDPNETVILYVKKNGIVLQQYVDWYIDGDNIVFVQAPAINDIIEVRYAVMHYSGAPELSESIIDLHKPVFSNNTSLATSAFVQFNKYLNDSVNITEAFSEFKRIKNLSETLIIDEANPQIAFAPQPTNETTIASDSYQGVFEKGLTEQLIINSAGHLQLNPYSSDLSFFAEDYVAGRSDFT